MIQTIVVQGAGIAGLTFAATVARAAVSPTRIVVLDQQTSFALDSLGGGIGLWPPSLHALEFAGVLQRLCKTGDSAALMPGRAAYHDGSASSALLASASPSFSERNPILCCERTDLLRALVEQCQQQQSKTASGCCCQVEICLGETIEDYTPKLLSRHGLLTVKTNKQLLDDVDMIIAADGIHSGSRGVAKLLFEKEGDGKPVRPTDCGYVYYRACLQMPKEDRDVYHGTAWEIWGRGNNSSSSHKNAATCRFGYVPLKNRVFWFAAMEEQLHGNDATALKSNTARTTTTTRPISEIERQHLTATLAHSIDVANATVDGVSVRRLLDETPASDILLTPISKIDVLPSSKWASRTGRVALIGDSAHAVAPNLAMGAGISIEDAAELALTVCKLQATHASSVELRAYVGQRYVQQRRGRAVTVQTLADLVAAVGQMKHGAGARDYFMKTVSNTATSGIVSGAQQRIFDMTAKLALGGSTGSDFCRPSLPFLCDRVLLTAAATTTAAAGEFISPHLLSEGSTMLARALDSEKARAAAFLAQHSGRDASGPAATSGKKPTTTSFSQLAPHVQNFRSSPHGGAGFGFVSTTFSSSPFVTLLRKIGGLPAKMEKQPFAASVCVSYQQNQKNTKKSGTGHTNCEPVHFWTRAFGKSAYLTTQQSLRSTFTSATPLQEETAPGFLGQFVSFQMRCSTTRALVVKETTTAAAATTTMPAAAVQYHSVGVVVTPFGKLWPSFRFTLPSFLAPTSHWREDPLFDDHACGNNNGSACAGWTFAGEIGLPPILLGDVLLNYKGSFFIDNPLHRQAQREQHQRLLQQAKPANIKDGDNREELIVIVTGCTGLVGRYLIQALLKKDAVTSVVGLSRDAMTVDKNELLAPSLSCMNLSEAQRSKLVVESWNPTEEAALTAAATTSTVRSVKWHRHLLSCSEHGTNNNNNKNYTKMKKRVCIVNLAGESLGDDPGWRPSFRRRVQKGRIDSIRAIGAAIEAAARANNNNSSSNNCGVPRVTLMQASGTGIYPSSDLEVKPSSAAKVPADADLKSVVTSRGVAGGRSFRFACVEAIEAAAARAVATSDADVVQLRIGIVLAAGQGALPHFERAAQLGARRFGSGSQFVPFVHVVDVAERIAAEITTATSTTKPTSQKEKIINIVATTEDGNSAAVTNREFLAAISAARGYLMPNLVPLVEPLLSKVLVGDSTCVLIDSCRAVDDDATTFKYRYPSIGKALESWETNVAVHNM